MAFPILVSENSSVNNTVNVNHIVDLPPSIIAGNLLVIIFSSRPTLVFTPNYWSIDANSSATQTTHRVYSIVADGTEGASIVIQTNEAVKSCHRTLQFSDYNESTPLEAITNFLDSNDANPNSAELTPTGGAQDYYWITCYGQRDDGPVTVYPTDYINTGEERTDTASGSYHMAWADRELNASSEDPGAFTATVAADWSAVTIAIAPAGVLSVYEQTSQIDVTITVDSEQPLIVGLPATHIQTGDINMAMIVDGSQGGLEIPSVTAHKLINLIHTGPRRYW